jgi:hypothetical protein
MRLIKRYMGNVYLLELESYVSAKISVNTFYCPEVTFYE